MGKLSKRLVALVSTVAVATGLVFTSLPASSASAADTSIAVDNTNSSTDELNTSLQADSVEDGVILHAWMWSFNSIKEHLSEIAAAGYTTIQTSPAQACRLGLNWNDTTLANTNSKPTWYYNYQPTYYTLGNYQLGTAEEFKAMTIEAHKLGLKIIVDVVANHAADTSNTSYVDSELLAHCHNAGRVNHWNVRNEVTQGAVIGMPDLDTSSSVIQNKIENYIDILSDAGADGFRFDAAKSIELPSQYEEAGNKSSDFWTNVINEIKTKNSKAFVYGEVLQGDEPGTNFPGYAKIMNVTASTYGWFARSAVGYEVWEDGKGVLGGNGSNGKVTPTISAGLTSSYMEGQVNDGSISNSKLVSFFETHDLYANAGASRCMSEKQRQLAWAIVASRQGAIPLFFNRPTSQSFGDNYLAPQGEAFKDAGQAGSDDYKQQNVVAMNKFHTIMEENNIGEKTDALNNNNVYRVQRGNKGLVLVNVSTSNQSVKISNCNLSNGTYNNGSTFGEKTYTVSGGSLSVNLPAQSFIVLSQEGTPVTEPTATISPEGGDFYGDSIDVTFGLSNATSGTYQIGSNSAVKFTSSKTVSVGSDLKVGQSVTVKINATDGKKTSDTKSYTFTKQEAPILDDDVYCVKPSNWGNTVYCYAYKDGSSNLAKWPGTAMTKKDDGSYGYDLPEGWSGNIIFNDGGSNQYPASGKAGLVYEAGKVMKYENGSWVEVPTEKTPSNTISKAGGEFTGNSIDVTVGLSNATSGTIKIGSNAAETYTSSITKTIGADLKVGQSVTVALTATNGSKTTNKEYTFTKIDTPISSDDIYCAKQSGWGDTLYCYAYTSGTNNLGKWPGNAMTKNADGTYSYDLPDGWSGNIIFNDGGSNQYPGSGQPGLVYEAGTKMIYKDGKWVEFDSKLKLDSLTASKTTIDLGEAATITPSITGGKAPYTYSYTVNNEVKDADANGILTLMPEEEGTYVVNLSVKDADGTVVSGTVTVTVTFNNEKPFIKSIDAVKSGSNITYTVNAIGGQIGTKLLFYKFYTIDANGNKSIGQNYSLENTFTTTEKTVLVEVQNSYNDTVSATYTYEEPVEGPSITSYKTSLESPQLLGTSIKLTQAATGGKGTLKYAFKVTKDGVVTYSKDFSTATNAIWTPDTAGSYKITYLVKDGNGTQDSKTLNYEITSVSKLSVDLQSPTANDSLTLGNAINLKAVATGAQGTVKYRFAVYKNSESVFVRGYKAIDNATWTPSETGKYMIIVKAIDDSDVTVSSEKVYVTVKAKISFKINKFTAGITSPQEANTLIVLRAGASGGASDIQYKFTATKDGKTTVIKGYSAKSYTSWKPTEEGTYTLRVYANDGTDTIIKKMTYVITKETVKELDITSITTDLNSPQPAGKAIKLVTNAVNGEGTLSYRFVVLKDGANVYTRGYNSKNNTVWTATEAGNYTIVAKVKDSTGKEVSKSITYTVK